MNHRQSTIARLLLVLGLFASVISLGLSDTSTAHGRSRFTDATTTAGCYINLVYDYTNCPSGAVSVLSLSNHRVLLRFNLHPAQYRRARFDVTYNAEPTNWTVNIGDSVSNDGGGGDAGNQTYDAELQVYKRQFLVRGNDYTPVAQKSLALIENFAWAGSTVSFTVANEHVDWRSAGLVTGSLDTGYLYGLNGQYDSEQGGTNYDIYAAFNRVIDNYSAFNYPRLGSGVSEVYITLE